MGAKCDHTNGIIVLYGKACIAASQENEMETDDDLRFCYLFN